MVIGGRDPVPVFIDLLRLFDLNPEVFGWVCDGFGLDLTEDTDRAAISEMGHDLAADIIRFGDLFILREAPNDFKAFDVGLGESVELDDEVIRMLNRDHRINPLRSQR